jgi:hypothetical protein
MNLDYLKNTILPQRAKEITGGFNHGTAKPIYVVLDLIENFVSGHSEYSANTNLKGCSKKHGYIDSAEIEELKEFRLSPDGMEEPEEVTILYVDRIVAFFLTSKSAHEYMEYQKHNLTNPYVYVFSVGYGNVEMNRLLQGE